MTKFSATIPALVGVVVLLASCSTNEAGAPESDNDTNTGSASNSHNGDLPHSGAPPVTDPIDTEQWQSDPCAVITAKQFSSIGFDNVDAEPDQDTLSGPTCSWYPDTSTVGSFSGAFGTADPPTEGLSRVYKRRQLGDYTVWQELDPIADYPAIRAEYKDESKNGICGLAVGIRDDLVYTVQVNDKNNEITKDPCAFAQKIATLAVKTMKGGA